MAKKIFGLLFIMTVLYLTGCTGMDWAALEALTETATPSPTVTNTATPTLTPLPTTTPTQTPTPVGGGSGKFLFVGIAGVSPDITESIYSYDLETGGIQLILEGYNLEDISPDGTQMLVSKSDYNTWVGTLYLANIDGTQLEEISDNFPTAGSDGEGAAWIEDGELIVFRKEIDNIVQLVKRTPSGEYEQITHSSLGVLNFDPVFVDGMLMWEEGYANRSGSWSHGYQLTNLGDNTTISYADWASETPEREFTEIISPNGEYVAFREWDRVEDVTFYGLADIDYSEIKEIKIEDLVEDASQGTTTRIEHWEWLPDGSGLFIFIPNGSPYCLLCEGLVLSETGEILSRFDLSEFRLFEPLRWSPDGKQMMVRNLFSTESGKLSNNYVRFSMASGFEVFLEPELVGCERLSGLQWLP